MTPGSVRNVSNCHLRAQRSEHFKEPKRRTPSKLSRSPAPPLLSVGVDELVDVLEKSVDALVLRPAAARLEATYCRQAPRSPQRERRTGCTSPTPCRLPATPGESNAASSHESNAVLSHQRAARNASAVQAHESNAVSSRRDTRVRHPSDCVSRGVPTSLGGKLPIHQPKLHIPAACRAAPRWRS